MCLLLKECDESGENYSIAKLRDLGADEAEKMEKRKKRKNPDQGFSGEQLEYNFLISFMKKLLMRECILSIR